MIDLIGKDNAENVVNLFTNVLSDIDIDKSDEIMDTIFKKFFLYFHENIKEGEYLKLPLLNENNLKIFLNIMLYVDCNNKLISCVNKICK